MAIFDYLGNQLNACFDADGNALSAAFDADGNQVFPDSGAVTLKVMTYNVGRWYDGSGSYVPAAKEQDYYNLQYNTFNAAQADFCGIEEWSQYFTINGGTVYSKPLLDNFFSNYVSTEIGTYSGRALCSKTFLLSGYSTHEYATPSGDIPSYYDSAYAVINGQKIVFVVTHLGGNTTIRQSQIPELLAYLDAQHAPNGANGAKVPVICFGDMNMNLVKYSAERDLYYNFCDAKGFDMVNQTDFDTSATVDADNYSLYPNYFGRFYATVGSGQGLDNILFSEEFEFVSAYVDDRKLHDALSDNVDHMPLIATLRIN